VSEKGAEMAKKVSPKNPSNKKKGSSKKREQDRKSNLLTRPGVAVRPPISP
jgi:hypothetical protein